MRTHLPGLLLLVLTTITSVARGAPVYVDGRDVASDSGALSYTPLCPHGIVGGGSVLKPYT